MLSLCSFYGKEERMAGLILWGMNMIYQERYVYHIKDEYFEKVQDFNFMQNKEGGTHRPISLSSEMFPM